MSESNVPLGNNISIGGITLVDQSELLIGQRRVAEIRVRSSYFSSET